MSPLPRETLRLFAHDDPAELARFPAYVLVRLLEDGDSRDLAWMLATFGEERARRVLTERGGRQLSARSRAFWTLVLGQTPGAAVAGSEELWPL